MYCYESIEKILKQTNIKEYIEKNNLKCKKCGGNLCVHKGIYFCPICKKNGSVGNIFTLVMEKENVNFLKAAKCLAEREGIQLEECVLQCDNVKYEQCRKCDMHERYKRKND